MEIKEIKLKFKNCGAIIQLYEKKCSYCGSINPNYKQKEIKPPKIKEQDIFKGLFGNVFADILDDFEDN